MQQEIISQSNNRISKFGARISIFLALFLAMPSLIYAADLGFSPISASHSVGQTFNVRVEVNPDGSGVNAVETEISYDKSKLNVVALSKTGSAFSLWTTEPEFSNSAGTISFGGGSPTPFSRTSALVTITFRAVSPGSAEVSFNSASVLAADGLGTDVFSEGKKSIYTITQAEAVPEPEPTPVGDRPGAPVVESGSHPNEDTWYTDDTVEFSWRIPKGVSTVRILLDSTPDSDPTVAYSPPIDTRIIDNLDEGISYLHVDFKNEGGFSETTHRTIRIDQSPPAVFDIVVVPNEDASSTPFLSFATTDEVSDIERYEIVVSDNDPVTLTPEKHSELPDEGWQMPRLFDGTYLVTVRAFDLAGNMTESDVSVELATGYSDAPPASTVVVEEDKGINWWLILVLILLLINLILVAIIYMQRASFIKERDYLRRETKEVRQKMEKIFSVLQDELEEQIRSLDKKPRLSADEKRVLKSMREALEVSEAFINKEIDDVEKVLE